MTTARSVKCGQMRAQGWRGSKRIGNKKPSSRHYRMPHNQYCTLLHQAVRADRRRRDAEIDPFALREPVEKLGLKERIVGRFKRLLGRFHRP